MFMRMRLRRESNRGYIATQYYNLSEATKSVDEEAVAAFNILRTRQCHLC